MPSASAADQLLKEISAALISSGLAALGSTIEDLRVGPIDATLAFDQREAPDLDAIEEGGLDYEGLVDVLPNPRPGQRLVAARAVLRRLALDPLSAELDLTSPDSWVLARSEGLVIETEPGGVLDLSRRSRLVHARDAVLDVMDLLNEEDEDDRSQ